MNETQRSFSPLQKILAYGVHLYTSLGICTGFMALNAIHNQAWKEVMIWLFIGLFIDGSDGSLARWAKVKTVLPNIDGKSIDYVIDFANYAFIPAYLIYASDLLPESIRIWAAFAILLVSAMYYGKTSMVSEDLYFEGFPVLWNMVAFYLMFVWDLNEWMNAAMVALFCILHFVPIKYVYPSRSQHWFKLNIAVTILFFLSNGLILFFVPDEKLYLKILANGTVAYLFIAGLVQSIPKSR